MQKISYSSAIERLNEILEILENQITDVDDMVQLSSEAKQLVDYCQDKIQQAENKIQEMWSSDSTA